MTSDFSPRCLFGEAAAAQSRCSGLGIICRPLLRALSCDGAAISAHMPLDIRHQGAAQKFCGCCT